MTITDNGHGGTDELTSDVPPLYRQLYHKGPVTIVDNVWIGDKAPILPGVTIGNNAIIAANSVVTHGVPPFTIVASNLAKVVKRVEKM